MIIINNIQIKKIYLPFNVTDDEMDFFFNDKHLEKTPFPIFATEEGIVNCVSD